MFKKIFYTLTILAMLFGMFGVMGKGGVTPAFAAAGFNVGAGPRAAATGVAFFTPLPYYNAAAIAPWGAANSEIIAALDGKCLVAGGTAGIEASVARSQAWAGVGADVAASFLRVRVDPVNVEVVVAGVFAQSDATFTALGCGSNFGAAGAAFDLVASIPANTPVYVIVSSENGAAAVNTGNVAVWMMRSAFPSGGLIVQSLTDAVIDLDGAGVGGVLENTVDNAVAQVQNIATADKQQVIVDGAGIAWFDIPAGIYNLGYTCDGIVCLNAAMIAPATPVPANTPYVARFASIVAGGYAVREPWTASIGLNTYAEVQSADPIGGVVTLNYRFRPTDTVFGYDFVLGLHVAGTKIGITAGPWTAQGYLDAAVNLPDYDLFSTQLFPVGANTIVDFRLQLMGGVSATRVNLCVPALREAATIDLTVAPFAVQTFNFFNGGLTSGALTCPVMNHAGATQGGYMYLSTVVDYTALAWVNETTGADWQYWLEPTPDPFPIATAGVLVNSWSTIFADVHHDTFFTAPDLTGGPEFVMPISSVTLARDTWNDDSGNLLTRVTGPDNTELDCITGAAIIDADLLRDEIAPCYMLWQGLDGEALLANDWLLTGFTPAVGISRYEYDVFLQTGTAYKSTNGVTDADVQILFAVSPSDTPMLGHWAWSWVEAMYELGLTSGINANNYAPDQVMTRAQMAVFLSNVLSEYSSIPAAGAGVGGVFTDVPAAFWAGGAIEQLESLGITSGIGGGLYAPNAVVTRAEMSKFIQLTFRAAAMFNLFPDYCAGDFNCSGLVWTPFGEWDVNQNVLAPGLEFVDVPADHWANLWIEEMAFDGLTDGCRTEMSGLAFIHYYCPDDSVTRGQMAKFILTAVMWDVTTQWNWPVLAPER